MSLRLLVDQWDLWIFDTFQSPNQCDSEKIIAWNDPNIYIFYSTVEHYPNPFYLGIFGHLMPWLSSAHVSWPNVLTQILWKQYTVKLEFGQYNIIVTPVPISISSFYENLCFFLNQIVCVLGTTDVHNRVNVHL